MSFTPILVRSSKGYEFNFNHAHGYVVLTKVMLSVFRLTLLLVRDELAQVRVAEQLRRKDCLSAKGRRCGGNDECRKRRRHAAKGSEGGM
eukprot:3348566-Pleurochrysis_carterae.AAC.3